MDLFGQTLQWFADGSHWTGPNGIPTRMLEHIELSAAAVALALLIALPAGLIIGHTRRGQFVAVSVANLGRAIPSFAILSIVFQIMLVYFAAAAFGFWPTVIALFLLAIPPILTNTYVGVQSVDQDVVEAARGMGMRERQVLRHIELPLGAPLMIAGVRTSAVQVVATATLAALIAGGGLGRYIVDGFAQGDEPKVLAGAILVAVLAIVTEATFALVQRAVLPRTSSAAKRKVGFADVGQTPTAPESVS
jgi:osmoprotectant transport system permease protein